MTKIQELRFVEALTLLCKGRKPPNAFVDDWFNKKLDSFDLQEWAIDNGPNWAQGIILIDAAMLIAMNPAEGEED